MVWPLWIRRSEIGAGKVPGVTVTRPFRDRTVNDYIEANAVSSPTRVDVRREPHGTRKSCLYRKILGISMLRSSRTSCQPPVEWPLNETVSICRRVSASRRQKWTARGTEAPRRRRIGRRPSDACRLCVCAAQALPSPCGVPLTPVWPCHHTGPGRSDGLPVSPGPPSTATWRGGWGATATYEPRKLKMTRGAPLSRHRSLRHRKRVTEIFDRVLRRMAQRLVSLQTPGVEKPHARIWGSSPHGAVKGREDGLSQIPRSAGAHGFIRGPAVIAILLV